MRIDVYDHQDRWVEALGNSDILTMTHSDELNGTDSLKVSTTKELRQGYRLVWQDRIGRWHEHVCQDPEAMREGSIPIWSDTALDAICETAYDPIEDSRPYGYSFVQALMVALRPTRWEIGKVDQAGSVDGGLRFYRTSARKAINQILEDGGELETTYEVGDHGVTARKIGIRAHRGRQGGHRRFTYRKDLLSLSRTEHWGAITACYGYGKSLQTKDQGHTPKLDFADVNGGRAYITDDDALKLWGRPDGKGGLAHVFGTFEDSNCEDPRRLLSETRDYLDQHKDPGVSYEADVVDLVAMGREWEGVGVGDDVTIVDPCFSPTLRCQGRVTKLVTDYVAGTQEVTLGNVTDTLADAWAMSQTRVGKLEDRTGDWDAAGSTTVPYLESLMAHLNERFNVSGASYTHNSFEHGTIWASVPMDDEGKPTKSGGSAIQLCSQGLRIAAGTTADGDWDWRTFGTGKGFVADMITTGVLDAALIKAGVLTDKSGKNFWNMLTGELSIQATTKVGDSTVASKADTDKLLSGVDVYYAEGESATDPPTDGWSTDPPVWHDGAFIWSKTITTKAGKKTETKPVCVTGAKGRTGEPGDDGTSVTVRAIEYASGTSGTTAPTSGWQTTVPSVAQGSWLWVRTTFSDGSTAVTCSHMGTDGEDGTSVAIQSVTKSGKTTTIRLVDGSGKVQTLTVDDGADGATGDGVHIAWATSADGTKGFSTSDSVGKTYLGVYSGQSGADSLRPSDYSWSLIKGADGTSVSVRSVEWSVGDSGTTAPTKWGADIPSVPQGKWLWCRTWFTDGHAATTSTYMGTDGTDGKSVSVRSVTKSGKVTTVTLDDGGETRSFEVEDGTDGDKGNSGKTGYVHVAWATSADGRQGFSTKDSMGKTYLGVYTDNAEEDSTTPSDYSWSLIKGETGATGTGVSKLVEQYYLSTSSTAQEGGAWSSEQPAWESGRHMWTRSEITWTDGKVTHTDPVLAKAIDSANEAADAASTTSNATKKAFDELNTQEGIFDTLTNGGKTQGIYLQNGLVYINGEYIKADTVQTKRLTNGQGQMFEVGANVGDDTYAGFTYSIDGTDYFKVIPVSYGSAYTDGVVLMYKEHPFAYSALMTDNKHAGPFTAIFPPSITFAEVPTALRNGPALEIFDNSVHITSGDGTEIAMADGDVQISGPGSIVWHLRNHRD